MNKYIITLSINKQDPVIHIVKANDVHEAEDKVFTREQKDAVRHYEMTTTLYAEHMYGIIVDTLMDVFSKGKTK